MQNDQFMTLDCVLLTAPEEGMPDVCAMLLDNLSDIPERDGLETVRIEIEHATFTHIQAQLFSISPDGRKTPIMDYPIGTRGVDGAPIEALINSLAKGLKKELA